MNGHRIRPARPARVDVLERLSKRLDDLAEREGYFSNAETIRAMREAYFADVDEFVKSGQHQIPK